MKRSTMKNLPTIWQEEADAMTTEQLRAVIIDSTANLADIEKAKEDDEELADLREAAKEAAAPYSDAKKAQLAKADYALHRLKEKGIPVGTADVMEAAAELRESMRNSGLAVSVSIAGEKTELGKKEAP